jgi:uncharacterized protein YraI
MPAGKVAAIVKRGADRATRTTLSALPETPTEALSTSMVLAIRSGCSKTYGRSATISSTATVPLQSCRGRVPPVRRKVSQKPS